MTPDGLILIADRGATELLADPPAQILDRLAALRVEVAALRRDVSAPRVAGVPSKGDDSP